MGEITGSVRNQYRMFCLEQSIETDSEARFIDAFVESMDLEDLGFDIRESKTRGRKAYSSSSIVKLYVYGYYNNIRSSRQLERACRINLELKWLINEICPSYKTISEFRRVNSDGFINIFEFLMTFLHSKGQFADETTIAVDGTRLHGQNSKLRNFNEKKLNQLISRGEKQIEQYMQELDQADSNEKELSKEQPLDKEKAKANETVASVERAEKIEKLKKLKGNLVKNKELLSQLDSSEDEQISTTDPDSRRMGRLREGSIVGYNGQIATTGKSKLIVAADVKNKPDTNTLANMALEAQGHMRKEKLNVLADCGFSESDQLKECEDAGLTTYVPGKPAPYEKAKGEYAKSKFIYDANTDTYQCPNNKHLQTNGKWYVRKTKGRKEKRYKEYVMRNNGCVDCPFRMQCQTAKEIEIKKQKHLKRYEHEEYKLQSNERAKANPEFYKQRKAIVEHPFGTLKRSMGFTFFLLRGLKKVNAEFRLICSCYNIKRLLNMYDQKELIKAFKALFSSILAILVLSRFRECHSK